MAVEPLLSKTAFLRGLRCKKSLYLDRFHAGLRDAADPAALKHVQEGLEVHQLAREYIPCGVDCRNGSPFAIQKALDATDQSIKAGVSTLYEAAIRHDRIMAYIDILTREGEEWELLEVKSAVSVKDHYLWDVAFQVHLLEKAGFALKDASVLHLNNGYVRSGELAVDQLFTRAPVLDVIRDPAYDVEEEIGRCLDALTSGACPVVEIGIYCRDPDDCDFMGECWAHIPSPSVFDVYRLAAKDKFDLYRRGAVLIEDIPESYQLNANAAFHVQSHKSGREIIKREAVREFLDLLEYPLHFLDFETFNKAIPPYDGLRPYIQIPYQYSLHLLEARGAGLLHKGYLGEPGSDPREEFLDHLLQDILGLGDVLVYNIGFERMVLNDLAVQFPACRARIAGIIARMVDLMEPFRKRLYYVYEMHGSSSLKAVLPALVPDLNYDDLQIGDGMQAMHAYLKLVDEKDPESVEKVRKALWAYCELDTLAMVRIVQKLEEVAI